MSRKLHIGGQELSPGWEILDVNPGPNVDHVGNVNDLSMFSDCTFSDIYVSHVLEHLDYTGELQSTLREMHRLLEVSGSLYISVPDLDILARLLLSRSKLTLNERLYVMRMMFGGHLDEHDYHVVGLNQDFMVKFLSNAGFTSITKVEEFGMFDDSSGSKFKDEFISLNLIVRK